MDTLRSRAYGFLRWTEKYFKTDMVYAASGGFWLFFGQAMTLLVSLGSAVAFANLLPAELYGNYKYILSVTGILGTFTLTGLSTALVRSVARNHEGALSEAFSLTLKTSVFMVIAGIIAGAYYLLKGNSVLGASFVIAGIFLPLISAYSLYRPFLSGKREFRFMSISGVLQNIVPVISVIATLFLTDNIIAIVAVYFAAQAVILFALYRFVKKNLVSNNEGDEALKHLGIHLSVMNVLGAIAGKLDSILIFQFLGGTDLAVFSFATAMPDQARASLKNITVLAVPKFAGKTKEELKKTVWSKSFLIFLISILGTIAYVILAPYIFHWLFPLYEKSVLYSQVYAVTIMSSLVLSSAYFEAQVAIKEKYILNIVANVSIIATTLIGVLLFGLWGAIFARIAARIIIIATSLAVIWKH